MKKFKVEFLLLFAIVSLNSFGDIVLVRPQIFAQVCIDNINDFKDITLLGVNDSQAPIPIIISSEIKQNVDLNIKYRDLSIYVIGTEYYKRIGLKNIDLDKDKNIYKINQTFKAQEIDANVYRSVVNYYSLIKEKQVYKLVKSKTIFRFKVNRPDVIEHHK